MILAVFILDGPILKSESLKCLQQIAVGFSDDVNEASKIVYIGKFSLS